MTGGGRRPCGTYGAILPRTPSEVCGPRCAIRLSRSGRDPPGSASAGPTVTPAATAHTTSAATDTKRRDMRSRLDGCPQLPAGRMRGSRQQGQGVGVGISDLLARQDGVISRRQVLSTGADDVLIARMLRRREWARVHAGVYVDHTGPLSWQQRAWAAVLYAEPAALAGVSALRAHGVRGHEGRDDVHVAVGPARRLRQPRGVRIERITDFDRVVQSHLSPPRVRVEHALVSVASAARTDDAAVGVLADGCQSRRSTPSRLALELRLSPRAPRRRLLLAIVDDVSSGAMSALERRYLRDVERAHGLPQGRRQSQEDTGSGRVQRDVEYVDQACCSSSTAASGTNWHSTSGTTWIEISLQRPLGVSPCAPAGGRCCTPAAWRRFSPRSSRRVDGPEHRVRAGGAARSGESSEIFLHLVHESLRGPGHQLDRARLAASMAAGERTCSMAIAEAPRTPASPPARDGTIRRCSVASGRERW